MLSGGFFETVFDGISGILFNASVHSSYHSLNDESISCSVEFVILSIDKVLSAGKIGVPTKGATICPMACNISYD